MNIEYSHSIRQSYDQPAR